MDLIKITDLFDESFFPSLSFKNFKSRNDFFTPIKEAKITYPMDIYDTKEAKIFELVVLDAKAEDIDILAKGSIITVMYNKMPEDEIEKKYECRRITRRAFTYSWKLPDLYCLDKTFVELNNGILKIIIPRQEKKLKYRKLDIQTINNLSVPALNPEVEKVNKKTITENGVTKNW